MKAPSTLYVEGNATNYPSMRFKGGKKVLKAFDSRLTHETYWSDQSSTTPKCDLICNKNLNANKFDNTRTNDMEKTSAEM